MPGSGAHPRGTEALVEETEPKGPGRGTVPPALHPLPGPLRCDRVGANGTAGARPCPPHCPEAWGEKSPKIGSPLFGKAEMVPELGKRVVLQQEKKNAENIQNRETRINTLAYG